MGARVLVVDDEPLIVTGLRVFLEDEGMQVESAASGEEAVDIIRNDSGIDVCIMDMRLPGMNGDSTIRALHAICPDLKFIIHTGSVEYRLSSVLKAIGVRRDHIFIKPVNDLASLVTAIQALSAQPQQEAP